MPEVETHCVCGHPLEGVAPDEESGAVIVVCSEAATIQARLEAIKVRRTELARELGSLMAEEDRLHARLHPAPRS